MSKLKELRENRASVFGQIDELRKAADGREMTAEEQTKWDTLLGNYERADKLVQQEERYQEVQSRQAEKAYESRQAAGSSDNAEQEYRAAFNAYLLRGESGVTAEHSSLFEQRAGITGIQGGVIVPKTLADSIEVALKSYGGMLEAGTIYHHIYRR